MARAQGDQNRYLTKQFSASGTVSAEDIKGFGRLLIITAGISLKMPEPNADLGDMTWEGVVVNPTTGDAYLTLNGTFNGGRSTAVVPAGGSVKFMYGLGETGYQCDVDGTATIGKTSTSYTPTLAWTTHDATGVTKSFYYDVHDGICEFEVQIAWTDGKDGTNVTITIPPEAPCMKADMDIPVAGYKVIDGAVTACHAYIDSSQAALEDRIIKLRTPATFTTGKTGSIVLKGWYPVYGFTSYSPTKVWGTEDPEAQTVVALYKTVEGASGSKVCYGLFQTLAADGNTSSSLTATLPLPTPDNNIYFQATSLQKVNTTWSNPKANVDGLSATDATRLLIFDDFTSHTNNNAHQESVAFIYEVSGWQSFTTTPVWGTADPTTVTKVGRFSVVGSHCLFGVYVTATDGNDTDELTLTPPVAPRYSAYPIALNAKELSNATKSNPYAYLDAAQTDPNDRLIAFQTFATIANATNGHVKVAGSYRIN